MSLVNRGPVRGSSRGPGGRPGAIGRGVKALGRAGMNILGAPRGAGGRRRRGRGITSRELRGFNKVARLLSKFGMVPRKMRGARLRKREDR
jgi:hypothetical protein